MGWRLGARGKRKAAPPQPISHSHAFRGKDSKPAPAGPLGPFRAPPEICAQHLVAERKQEKDGLHPPLPGTLLAALLEATPPPPHTHTQGGDCGKIPSQVPVTPRPPPSPCKEGYQIQASQDERKPQTQTEGQPFPEQTPNFLALFS